MNRRSFVFTLVAAPIAVALAACGDPNQQSTATEPTNPGTTPGTPPGTVPPTTQTPGIVHPTGSDDAVITISYQGGLVPIGYDFASAPALLVSGDGRVFTQGAVPAIYPGPLLPTLLVRTITETGIQDMLGGVVNAAGLLAAPADYSGGTQVADATSTVLTINAAGGTFVHSAYALGIDNPESPARQRLLDAVTSLTTLEATVGDVNLGRDEPFAATTYRLRARVVDASELTGQDLPPTVIDWPAGTGVALAEANECARVDAVSIGSLFTDANQNTFFKEGDIVYQLSVRGVLPGDPAC